MYSVGAYKNVHVKAIGGGGGGGGGTSGTNGWPVGGAGGGGGAGTEVSGTYDVYPGGTLSISIGQNCNPTFNYYATGGGNCGGARGIAGDELNIPVGLQGLPGFPTMVAGFLSSPYYLSASGGGGGQPGMGGLFTSVSYFVDVLTNKTRNGIYLVSPYGVGFPLGFYYYVCYIDDFGGSCSTVPVEGYVYDPNYFPASGAGGSIGGGHGIGPDYDPNCFVLCGSNGWSYGGKGGSSSAGTGGAGGGIYKGTYAGTGGIGAGGGGGGSSGYNPNDSVSFPGAGGPGYVSITSGDACSINFGTYCTSTTNACGATTYGTILCDGSCSATSANPTGYGTTCSLTSLPNACGQTTTTTTGTIGCDSISCTGTPPVTPPVTTPNNAIYNASCSVTNACGTNSGTITCAGTCSALTPYIPPNYGTACTITSPANGCGMTTTATGTYNCSGVCAPTPPAPTPSAPLNTLCAPPPAPTISGPYQNGPSIINPAYAYDPLGYQVFAQATSPYATNPAVDSHLTYYFEYSTDGVSWTRGDWAGQKR